MRTASRPPNLTLVTRAQAQVIWFVLAAILVAVVAAAIVVVEVAPLGPPAQELVMPLLLATGLLVVLDVVATYVVAWAIRRNAPPGAPPDAVAGTQVIVACAVSLGGTLFCAVAYYLTHLPVQLLVAAPAAAVMLHFRPSQARWAALGRRGGPPAEPRRNTMIRE